MELHCFPRVECRNGSRSRREAPPLPPPRFLLVSGQTRKIYFLESGRREPETSRGIILLHTCIKKDWLTIALNIAICLWGRCEIAERKPAPTGPSFHHVLRLSSNLRFFPSPHSFSLSLSPRLPVHRPTVLYLLTQLKKQSVERPRSAFYHADAANRLYARGEYTQGSGSTTHGGREGCRYIPNSHRENRTFRPSPTVFIPPITDEQSPSIHVVDVITSIHDFYANMYLFLYLFALQKLVPRIFYIAMMQTQRSRVDRKLRIPSSFPPFENYYSRFQIYRFVKYSNYIEIQANTYISQLLSILSFPLTIHLSDNSLDP